jgi:hypothetical protein
MRQTKAPKSIGVRIHVVPDTDESRTHRTSKTCACRPKNPEGRIFVHNYGGHRPPTEVGWRVVLEKKEVNRA